MCQIYTLQINILNFLILQLTKKSNNWSYLRIFVWNMVYQSSNFWSFSSNFLALKRATFQDFMSTICQGLATSPTSRLPVHISLKSYVSLQYKTFIWFEWAKIKVYCLTYWSSVFDHEFLAVLAFCTKIRKNTKKTLILGENNVIMTSLLRHIDVYPIDINELIMFYLTSKFHVNRINTLGFVEGGGGGGACEAPPPPPRPRNSKNAQAE